MESKKLRRSKRFPFRKRVKFGPKTPDHIGITMNFSKFGIQIESSKIFSPGTPLVIEVLDKLSFSDPNSNKINFIGKVKWAARGLSNTSTMGIEFLTQCKDIENEYKKISS